MKLRVWLFYFGAVWFAGSLPVTAQDRVAPSPEKEAPTVAKDPIKANPGPNTVLRDKSPDGKFGILYTYNEKDLAHENRPEGVQLVALPSNEVVRDLYDDTENQNLAASWAPDSQHLAFHTASRRIAETAIYERRADRFEALKMPSMERFDPKMKKNERQGHFTYSDVLVKRWLGSKKLLVHYGIEFDVQMENGDTRDASSDYNLILAIDGKGNIAVTKATKTPPRN